MNAKWQSSWVHQTHLNWTLFTIKPFLFNTQSLALFYSEYLDNFISCLLDFLMFFFKLSLWCSMPSGVSKLQPWQIDNITSFQASNLDIEHYGSICKSIFTWMEYTQFKSMFISIMKLTFFMIMIHDIVLYNSNVCNLHGKIVPFRLYTKGWHHQGNCFQILDSTIVLFFLCTLFVNLQT